MPAIALAKRKWQFGAAAWSVRTSLNPALNPANINSNQSLLISIHSFVPSLLLCMFNMVSINPLQLARAALLSVALLQSTAAIITDDTYFYGESPAVYPSRKSISPVATAKLTQDSSHARQRIMGYSIRQSSCPGFSNDS